MATTPLGHQATTSKPGTLRANRLRQPDQVLPDISLIAYPQEAIAQRRYPGFIVADTFGDQINMSMGDTAGLEMLSGTNPTISDAWYNSSNLQDFYAINNVSFVRFANDGRFYEGDKAKAQSTGGLCGFILTGREGFLDSKIINDTVLDTPRANNHFEPLQGEWETILPPESPQRTFIRTVGSALTHKVQSAGDIPQNRSLRFDVQFLGQQRNDVQPAFRAIYGGGKFSLLLRQGVSPCLEQFISGQWRTLRQFSDAPIVDISHRKYVIRIRHIAGRSVISINETAFHHLHTASGLDGNVKPHDIIWQSGKIQFNCFNCRASIGFGVIKYADERDMPITGGFARRVRCNVPIKESERHGDIACKWGGWQRGGSANVYANFGQNFVTYQCQLTGSAEGIYSPFVSKVLLRFHPGWKMATSAGFSLRPYITNITVEGAVPQINPDMTMTAELDIASLSKSTPNWRLRLEKYAPISLAITMRYADNTKEAQQGIFRGYIFDMNESLSGYNKGTLRLTCRSSIARLQKPAAVIDHRYPPLDFLFAMRDSAAPVYGGDCVQEILRIALGEEEADAFNGNGDVLRYLPSHYPLIDYDGDTAGYFGIVNGIKGQPPTSSGFLFPPPFGEDALGWIKKIAQYDHAVFLYGWPQGYVGMWPVPIYGRWHRIMEGRRTWTISDKEYINGDLQRLIKSYETQTRPERDINRILVWANPGGVNAPEFLPSYRMAEARLPASHPNAAEHSWERTQVIKEDLGAPAGGAEALAIGTVGLLSEVSMIWPTVTLRGYSQYQWGDKVTFHLTDRIVRNNPQIKGKTFFIERVSHHIDMNTDGGDIFTTTLTLRPIAG